MIFFLHTHTHSFFHPCMKTLHLSIKKRELFFKKKKVVNHIKKRIKNKSTVLKKTADILFFLVVIHI